MTSGMRVGIEIDGVKQVDLAITRVNRHVSDLRPLWKKWQVAFFAAENDLFIQQPWKELNRRYAAWKAERFPGKGLLQRSGALRNSLTSMSTDHIYKAMPQAMEIGTGIPYAIYHQQGTSKMPPRPPLDLTKQLGLDGKGRIDQAGYFGRALVEWRHDLVKEWTKK